MRIRDYKCTYENENGIPEEIVKEMESAFPDVYCRAELLKKMAEKVATFYQNDLCVLPFCHTIEAEAMGGNVVLGNGYKSPRTGTHICQSAKEVLTLPEIDYSHGRIHETLLACRRLNEKGKAIVLEVSGPFTILNGLTDISNVYRLMHKEPEVMYQIFLKLESELLRYIEIALEYGVKMISYADPIGGVRMMGAKRVAQVVDEFTYDFLKKSEKLAAGNAVIILCPKTAFALLDCGKAEWEDVVVLPGTSYGKACREMIGRAGIIGQICIKRQDYLLKNGVLKVIKLH